MNVNELKIAVAETAGTEIVVTDAETREIACEFLKAVKAQMKKVTDFWAEAKKKAAEAHKAVCAQEKALLDPLKDAESRVKAKIGAFDLAERKRIAEEEERRRVAAAEAAALAMEAEAAGETEIATEAVAMAAMEAANVSYVPKTAGVSTRFEWRARVVDPMKVPRMFLVVDEKALAAYAKATKGKCQVDGVEFYEAPVVGARASF